LIIDGPKLWARTYMSPFLSREQVLALISEHAPPRLRQVLEENLAPAIGIIAREADDASLPTGASKIGGAPDVPRGFEWPAWKGRALGFVAQFNLEGVAPFDLESALPPSGTLSFFYAIEEQPWGGTSDAGAWQVLWWPREEELERRALPASACDRDLLPPHALGFHVRWQINTLTPDFTDDMTFEERQVLSRAFREALGPGDIAAHQLLGQSLPIQDPVEADLHERSEGEEMGDDEDAADYYRRLSEGGLKWRLLFQLDSESSGGRYKWMWGDAGILYFCIRHDDLKARRFDRACLQLQCH
jgi:uncharacterized protein YwqG